MYENGMEEREMELQREAPQRVEELCAIIESELPTEPNLRMEVTAVMPEGESKELRIGLRVGEQKWYVVKDIPAFLDAWKKKETLS